MIKLKLDDITNTQSMVLFNTNNLLEMFNNVIEYSHAELLYNDFQKRLDKLGFRFSNTKGKGICKIIVTSRTNKDVKFLFIY